MYDKIKNPLTGRWVNTKGHLGKTILNKYTKQYGGSPLPIKDSSGLYLVYKDGEDHFKALKINHTADKDFKGNPVSNDSKMNVRLEKESILYTKAIKPDLCNLAREYNLVCKQEQPANDTAVLTLLPPPGDTLKAAESGISSPGDVAESRRRARAARAAAAKAKDPVLPTTPRRRELSQDTQSNAAAEATAVGEEGVDWL